MTDSEKNDLFDRVKAALAETYSVERELGAGGMAIVFLAHDAKHDRQVAIKVLRPELAASIGVDRFLREIKSAAKLSHPHILPLHDSGEAGGIPYYVMPFIEGESLADLMVREHQLPIRDAVRISREVAEALSVAHSSELVHRDIKPENIMMSGGHAMVADFGIARAINQAGGDKLTQTGMAVGTPAYMSPEQAAGDPNVDGRTDIYSLGCVLYEMLVGQVPFTGPTPMAVMARHTMDHVTPPSIMRSSIPEELEDAILCAMAKTPADRFRTAAEFAEALSAVETGAVPHLRQSRMTPTPAKSRKTATGRKGIVATLASALILITVLGIWQFGFRSPAAELVTEGSLDPRTIAVLYLEDVSPSRELGYLADGLTESLISELSRVRGLTVISRNGVASYRDRTVSLDSIARALGAGSLVTGTVQMVADRLRVSWALAEGSSGADYARAEFELPASDLVAAQDSLAESVALFLRRHLGEEIRFRERKASTSNVDAWVLVQRGERVRKEARELEGESRDAAIEAYVRADSMFALVETLDPKWGEPIVLRAEVARRRSILADDPAKADQWAETGIGHAERSLSIDATNPKALELRGTLRYYLWYFGNDPEPEESKRLLNSAREDLEAAVANDPTLASAYSSLSSVLYGLGDWLGANLQAMRAYEADAYLLNADRILNSLWTTSYDLQNFSEAKRWCEEGRRRFPSDPKFVSCQLWLFSTRAVEPDVDAAWSFLDTLIAVSPEHDREYHRREGQIFVAAALARAGLADSARNLLVASRGDADVDPDRSLVPKEAFIRTLLGDTDEAIRLLQSYMVFNPHHRHEETEDIHWWWRSIQDDPRYQQLLRRGD